MYVYCVYPAMSKVQNNCQNCQILMKKAEARVALTVSKGVLLSQVCVPIPLPHLTVFTLHESGTRKSS